MVKQGVLPPKLRICAWSWGSRPQIPLPQVYISTNEKRMQASAPHFQTNQIFFKPIKYIQVFISTRITLCNIITYKMTEQCNIQTTHWKDEIRIDVREWESKDQKLIPTRKAISLPLYRWKLLVESFDSMDKALEEKEEYKSHLGRNIFASVTKNNVCVDIRQHWLPPNQAEVVPTKRGITLRPEEYEKLKDVACVIGDFVPELSSVVPCPYTSDHMNQLGFLRCPECNPDNFRQW